MAECPRLNESADHPGRFLNDVEYHMFHLTYYFFCCNLYPIYHYRMFRISVNHTVPFIIIPCFSYCDSYEGES